MHRTVHSTRLRATFLRHPDDETPPADPVAEIESPAPDAPGDTPDVEKWKALARKHEQRAKDNADAARRLAELEDSQKSELERERSRAERAEQQAVAALDRARSMALRSAIVAAAADAVDPDAVMAMLDHSAIEVDDDLNVTGAVAAVAALLAAKPYLRRSDQPARPAPGAVTQGAGGSAPVSDPMKDRAALKASASKLGIKL